MKKRNFKGCDIAVFTSSVSNLKERTSPVLRCLEFLIFVIRFESTSITIFVWMICIFICQNITAGFVFVFLCMLLLCLAAYGYVVHLSRNSARTEALDQKRRQTLLFLQYSSNENTEYHELQEKLEKHKVVLSQFKQHVSNIQEIAVYSCTVLDKICEIFCWRDMFISSLAYLSLFILLLSLLFLPVRWTLSLLISLLLAGCSHIFSPNKFKTVRNLSSDTDIGLINDKETSLLTNLQQSTEGSKVTDKDADKVGLVASDQQLETINTREEDSDKESEIFPIDDLSSDANFSGIKRGNCYSCNISFSTLSSWQYCRNCGYDFCPKCCSKKVPRSLFGATSPAARTEREYVCKQCYQSLLGDTLT